MSMEEELRRMLDLLSERTGKNLWIQTEDGQILASTLSEQERILREIMDGSLSPEMMCRRGRELTFDFSSGGYLFLLETDGLSRSLVEEAAGDILEHGFDGGMCVRNSDGRIALVLHADGLEDVREAAGLLQNALETEAMARASIGVSDCFYSPQGLIQAVSEARTALLAVHTFYQAEQVMVYRDLGLGLAALQMSETCAESYLRSVLGEAPERVLTDKELFRTAQVLLANGLNSAETARQLCVHRNTLTYRLDKIQKLSGRDLRRFEDAAAFRLATMVWQKIEKKIPKEEIEYGDREIL